MSALASKLFKKPTPREQLRQSQRDVGRNVRDLERELAMLKREEAKLVKDIKDAAQKGNLTGAQILAKNLVRLRGQQAKLQQAMANLRGVNITMATSVATGAVGQTMGNAAKAMQAVGATQDLKQMQQAAVGFAKESQRVELAAEMMDDAIEGALDSDGLEEESNEVMNQVLDEIGIDLTKGLKTAPRHRLAGGVQQGQQQQQQSEEDELVARMLALK